MAPAFAARSACTAEKQSVTFVFTPSAARTFTAFSPSTMSGILMTTWLPNFA